MSERKRVFLLVLIMAMATAAVVAITIFTLYSAAFEEERARLVETAQSQARLMEAVARFDAVYSRDYPGGAEEATLNQIIDAHKHYEGFGETGEFTLAKREGDYIVFLLSHRHLDLESPMPVAFDSDLAEPMRRALSGMSGTVVGLDYRGALVLAAHEPVEVLGQGIVAKIDLSEIRAPFLRAGAVAAFFALLVVAAGTGLFFRVSNPMIRRLEEHAQQLEETMEALRESEEKYRSMMEAMNDPVYICSPDFRVEYMNPVMVERTGRDAKGEPCHKAINDLDEKCPWCVHEEIQQGERAETEIESPRDGRFYHVSHSPILHVDGSISKMTIFRDITEQKQAQEAIKKSSEQIRLFAYSVSHDLKSPAIGLYGLTRLLHKQYRDVLDEKGKHYCNQILEGAEQIAALVDKINVYISTREMPLNIDNVELIEILQMVRDEFSPQLDIRQIRWLQPESMPEIRVDRLSVLRILRNIVDNALKYGGDDLSEMKIGYEASDEFHYLSVSDDGVGVKGENTEKIFDVFQRHETARGVEGMGLGLAIVRELTEQHGGKVWVEPGPEKGTTFYVSISRYL
jgi:PAS domain S-box-containing protein